MLDDNNKNNSIKKNQNDNDDQKKHPQQQQQRKLGSRGQRQKLNKNALRLLTGTSDNIEDGGVFPQLFNIAPRSIIYVNGTCGENGREEYCKLIDAYPHQKWSTQCGICNSQSLININDNIDDQYHTINKILDNNINLLSSDNNNNWWQSPTLRNGRQFEYITITLDLRQIYQIFFIMLKAAISPRPASWILEKSMDNITYEPWQYFGLSDNDCRRRYNIPGQTGKYIFIKDNEVICTTQYSKAMPLENGEIHVSLLKNRPGALEQTIELMNFISARYIRIRLQGMHSTANIDNSVDWLLDSQSLEKRSFYSLKQIRISGRLNCHGHANRTFETILGNDENNIQLECACIHNTCGIDCNQCCPLHQEKPFRDGTLKNKNLCTRCQCNGHSQQCQYDSNFGKGICENCHNNTDGNKCELCLPGYFRPIGIGPEIGCKKCECNEIGIIDNCNPDGGKCNCRDGFVGEKCEFCAQGYYGEKCLQCACDKRGTIAGAECDEICQCKQYVEGEICSQCSLGYFGLQTQNTEGCLKCYCSGVGLSCKSSHIQTVSYETLDQWKVTDLSKTVFAYPTFENSTGNLIFGMYDLPDVESFYWLAPKGYLGNKLTSYGSKFLLQLSWIVIRGDTSGKPTTGPNIILFGRNGIKIAYGDDDFYSSSALINIELRENGWYHIPKSVKDIVTRMRRDEYHGDAVTRAHLMSVLTDLEAVLIRGRFHTDQVESILERATMYSGDNDYELDSKEQSFIEECICPPGYTGLSCENCDFGYIRVYENLTSNYSGIGKCIQCPCNGHAEFCDLQTGKCDECQHNTYGERCERCKVGFYGNPMQGTKNDCKRCACPLSDNSNNFSPSCQLKKLSLDINQFGKFEEEQNSEYICTQCPTSMIGDHCEMCEDGFYGNPTVLGSNCQPCNCDGGPCDIFTGQCIECLGNTEGWRCQRCKLGYWGDPEQGCKSCDCYDQGSTTDICDLETGQCLCKLQFNGLKCNKCDYGYADIDLKCPPCQCNINGSTDIICDPLNGQCICKLGVTGLKCDQCDEEYFNINDDDDDVECEVVYSSILFKLNAEPIFVTESLIIKSHKNNDNDKLSSPAIIIYDDDDDDDDIKLNKKLLLSNDTNLTEIITTNRNNIINNKTINNLLINNNKKKIKRKLQNQYKNQQQQQSSSLFKQNLSKNIDNKYKNHKNFNSINNSTLLIIKKPINNLNNWTKNHRLNRTTKLWPTKRRDEFIATASSSSSPEFSSSLTSSSTATVNYNVDKKYFLKTSPKINFNNSFINNNNNENINNNNNNITTTNLNHNNIYNNNNYGLNNGLKQRPIITSASITSGYKINNANGNSGINNNYNNIPKAKISVSTILPTDYYFNNSYIINGNFGSGSSSSGLSTTTIKSILNNDGNKDHQLILKDNQDIVIYRKFHNGIPCPTPIQVLRSPITKQTPIPNQQQQQHQPTKQQKQQQHHHVITVRPRYRECLCSSVGSASRVCDRRTGQCFCHTNVIGRRCDKCRSGNWNLTVDIGCQECQCNNIGSLSDECDAWTGQCLCKQGIGGKKCNQCLDGYYGFTNKGCIRCDACQSVGHVCDSETGRCICPPNSKGPDCVQCLSGTWGWKTKIGCDKCHCDIIGSIGQTCNIMSGQCICREGYTGRRCNSCSIGYFGYPDCRRCNCNIDGSFIRDDGLIECDTNGQCPCKELVIGLKCDTCVHSTFGLAKYNPEGCTKCFCFSRSQECQQSDLSWGHVRIPSSRNLTIQYVHPLTIPNREYDYIVVVQMEGTEMYREDAEIGQINGLNLIPSSVGNVTIGAYTTFYYPLYFQLPPQFYGDKTNSYGGFLKFSIITEGCTAQLDKKILYDYPLVQIHAHNKLILDYFHIEENEMVFNETYNVPLHESFWKFHHNRKDVSRAIMMAALQNIKHIFLRGTSWADFHHVVLQHVLMDAAIYLSGSTNIIAHGVEKCSCSNQYTGLSCQDPGQGYYRWKNNTEIIESVFLEDLIGRSIPCECNGRSEECNQETGVCLNCRDSTGGHNCERCAEGYYGDPNYNGCQSCPCPETSKNFARGCTVWNNDVNCICKIGYTGQLCDRCRNGYFGYPKNINGSCDSCNCNENGIISDECDEETGQCNCRAGVTGRQCNICEAERHYLEDKKCKLCDNCTLILMDYVESIAHKLRRGIAHMDLTGIPAPWLKLEEYDIIIDLNTDRLDNLLNTKRQLDNFDGTAVEKLISYAENTKIRWRKLNTTAIKRNIGAGLLRANSNQLQIDSMSIRDGIYRTMFELSNYGTHDHHISLPIALDHARNYLKDIKSHDDSIINMRSSWNCAWNNFYYYGNASDMVFDQKAQLEMFWIGFNNTNRRFADIEVLTDKTFDILNESDDIQEHIINTKIYLQENNDLRKELLELILKYLNHNYIPETNVYLDMIDGNHDQILANIQNIKNLQNFWNESLIDDNKLRYDLTKNWLPKSWQHANLLLDRSNEYSKQFQPTKDGARVALLASSAHQNISDAINAAKQAGIEAKQRVFAAQNKLYPRDGTSVIIRSEKSLEKSKYLQADALDEMTKINELKMDLKIHEDKVDSIKSIIWQAGIKNNNISSSLDLLNNDNAMKMSQNTRNLASKISDEMRMESRKAVDIKSDIYKLRQKFASLEPDWDTKLGMAEENISQTLSNIRTINNSLNNAEGHHYKANQKFQLWNDTVSKQLQELKDKIAKARHAAEGIKVSLESLTPKCIRSYIPHSIGLSTSNTIKLNLALNNRNGNSPLLFIQGHDRKFIALELYRRKVRLIWNLGGEMTTTILTHPLEIQTRDPKYDDAWYHIEANRTLNVGSLLVRRMTNNGDLTESNPVTGYSNLQYTRFYRSTLERIWLGGVPHNLQVKELQSSTAGLNVIVHQLNVDNKPLGLWNFAHSEGNCSGAMFGALESTASSNERHFNGQGYSVMRKLRPKPYRKIYFALQMEFKTWDENTLLFMAVDDKNNRTVSVSLNDGRIVFRIDYNSKTKLEISSIDKHNTGKWIKIEAARAFSMKYGTENGTLKIGNLSSISGSPMKLVTIDMLPDLSKSSFILGGIPPGFRKELIKDHSSNSFLGCMRDVAINGETYDALESSSYFGVEQSCKDIVAQAGFNGNGYIELPSQSLRKRANFAFVFRTLQPDCLLLLSGYPPDTEKIIDPKEMKGNYSVSLIDGHIHVWIDSGRSSVQLISNQSVNDGEYHIINVIKTGRRIELMIDDELQSTRSLIGSPNLINMPKDYGGLYLGGAPDYFDYKSISQTFIGLNGALRDIVFNNKSLVFSDALNFINVQIGRSGPSMGTPTNTSTINGISDLLMKTEPIRKIFTAVPSTVDGCQKVEGYSYEPNAYKYGDNQFSYSQMNIPIKNFWQKNFLIKFDLRTFYPNGILLISPGTKDKQKHYISLILKDGHLTLIVRGRRREELTLTAKLNNGEWHHIIIHCQDRKVTMSVEIGGTDQKTSVQMKIPKKISASNLIFIGGLPENSLHLPSELMMKLEVFKGCIRQLYINNITQDLTKDKKHLNVGNCFPKVEKGSYFPGNGYATFKKNFHVGKYLELEMVFRTSELNGILLSVSEPVGFPALSLEVHKGNVILSCDLGDGNPFRAKSILSSKYSICDNRWHNISALYDYEQIVLRVDNHTPTIALAQHIVSGKVQTKSPLYIGGIPDIAPSGTLLSRQNFKGCIRNVSIRNERKDWIDMDYLHNVLLSECLAI